MNVSELRDQIDRTAEPEVTYKHPRGSWSYQIAATDDGWAYRWTVEVRHPGFHGQSTPWGPYRGPRPTTRDDAIAEAVRHITTYLERNGAHPRALLDALHATTTPTLF